MENKIKFAPNVMLIDASYLDRVTCDLQAHFAPIVNRELPKADLAVLLECLALDAGMKLGNNEIQVIFIYESGEGRLEGLTPSDLGKELHGMAFKSELGEFASMPSSLRIWQHARNSLSSRFSWPVSSRKCSVWQLLPMKTGMEIV